MSQIHKNSVEVLSCDRGTPSHKTPHKINAFCDNDEIKLVCKDS